MSTQLTQYLSIFYPAPMDTTDYNNLDRSGVRRIQMFYRTALALPGQLGELKRRGIRVTLRLEEPGSNDPKPTTYYNGQSRMQIRDNLYALSKAVWLEAVIAGNEPEIEYDLTWHSATAVGWGNTANTEPLYAGGRLWEHQAAVAVLKSTLSGLPIRVVTPGWSHRRMTPNDPPQPGRATWARGCSEAYGEADCNGAHIYALYWLTEEDRNRFKWALGGELERCHRNVWINECNVGHGTALERMAAVIEMAQIARSHREFGYRVESFCFFVANGLGVGYSGGFILRDPAAYDLLGTYMRSEGQPVVQAA